MNGLMEASELKRRVTLARAEKSWTQKVLAKEAGVTPGMISDWLNGRTIPDTSSLQKLATALEKPLSYFIDQPKIIQIEDQPLRRGNYIWSTLTTGTRAVPGWIGAAAGNSREVERAAEPIYVYEKLPPDHRYFTIHGNSMINTLRDGDVVIVKDLGQKGLSLPPLRPNQPKTPVDAVKRIIPSNSIAVLSIDYSGLTVKRVKYATKPNNNWHLMLIADNTSLDDYPYPVPRDEEVTFWALVIGIAKKEGT